MKREDLTGRKFGRLTVVSYAGSQKWSCICECGNHRIVRADHLKSGNTQSCGCLNAENVHAKKKNMKDLTGKRFGDLEVLQYIRSDESGVVYRCKCHYCGREIDLCADLIKQYKSCGCKAKESAKTNISKLQSLTRETSTNPGILMRTKANANSSTGVRGVCYIKSQDSYVAYIQYKKIKYILKKSTDINVCIKARKEAEDAIRNDFTSWYSDYIKSDKS